MWRRLWCGDDDDARDGDDVGEEERDDDGNDGGDYGHEHDNNDQCGDDQEFGVDVDDDDDDDGDDDGTV